jgi:ABC-2 type transport system permease protein
MRALRAFPTMLRIGFAEAVAYRAEFLVWMLTTTMPLVMLALWTAVASEGPFQQFDSTDFVAYYLSALIVRTLTSCWLVWEMNQEIRMGTLSLRLLRPTSPFLSWTANHLAAVPMRALLVLPIALIMLATTGGSRVASDPVVIALVPLSILGAWGITFAVNAAIGSLGMLMERSLAIWEVWLAGFAVMSGYLVPFALMPGWMQRAAEVLPFRYQLGFPVEMMIGMTDRAAALQGLAVQWGMVAILGTIAAIAWRAGLRRFEACGA